MKELRLVLENCYGIQKMNENIDYSNKNVAIIYAPNGTMKSSLAKTFEDLRDGKSVEEKIFGYTSIYSVTDEQNSPITGDKIIVINPFNENTYDNQGLLMANETLRKRYLIIHKSINEKRNIYMLKLRKNCNIPFEADLM